MSDLPPIFYVDRQKERITGGGSPVGGAEGLVFLEWIDYVPLSLCVCVFVDESSPSPPSIPPISYA